ncbi:DNA alkylation repair enzyme [Bifidobacterium avesanii]|nr:DNA alkylation repair enzyme [Bifidobacterium avesanii]
MDAKGRVKRSLVTAAAVEADGRFGASAELQLLMILARQAGLTQGNDDLSEEIDALRHSLDVRQSKAMSAQAIREGLDAELNAYTSEEGMKRHPWLADMELMRFGDGPDFIGDVNPMEVDDERLMYISRQDLRELAGEFLREEPEWCDMLLVDLPHFFVEEDGLHAMVISKRAKTASKALEYLDDFLPHVIDAQTCDALRFPALKRDPASALPRLRVWTESDEPYTVRFAIMTLLRDFSGELFDPAHLAWVASVGECLGPRKRRFPTHHRYRVRSAVKRYFTHQLVHHYDDAVEWFDSAETAEDGDTAVLPADLHNDILSAAAASKLIPDERRTELRGLKVG